MSSSSRRLLRLLVLDMDGTLTLPGAIDFARMRARLGCPRGVDVLDHVAAAPSAAARAARAAVVEDEEALGAARLALAPDLPALAAFCAARPALRVALLTRNNAAVAAAGAAALRAAGLRLDAVRSREWAGGPPKPHPAALLAWAAEWAVAPAHLAMVGDSTDDVAAGRAAGGAAILIGAGDEPGAREAAHFHVPHLAALVALLEGEFGEGEGYS